MTPSAATAWGERWELANDEGTSKVMALGTAIRRFIHADDVVHATFTGARPCGPLFELVRQFAAERVGLTLSTSGIVSAQLALVETGVVRKLITSFAGDNYPIAKPNPAFQRALHDGRVEIESWSLGAFVSRLAAGAMGLPFVPTRSLAGSTMEVDLRAAGRYATVEDPFDGGRPVGVVPALRPDVTLLHGVAADAHGNVALAAPYGENAWGALAATRGAIACVERIVPTSILRAHSALVQVPAHCVLAVCELPLGAHPYSLYNPGIPDVDGYVEDHAFMLDAQDAARDEDWFRAWIDEWILGTADQAEYLAKLGDARRHSLVAAGRPDAWRAERVDDEPGPEAGFNENERMVVAAARRVASRIRANRREAVLAGVGLANLAACLGVDAVRGEVDVELMAEIGMYGYVPRPGEPFVFAHRNLGTVKLMSDVMSALGTWIAGPGTSSMGVVGAGQIDERGNINSTLTADGQFLVGSGGANDIASAADEVIVCVSHGRGRMVKKVPYVTAPGRAISTVVTTRAIFERGDDGGFVLTGWLSSAGADTEEAIAHIREGCDWDFAVADELAREPDPTAEELHVLRQLDPDRAFLRRLPASTAGR